MLQNKIKHKICPACEEEFTPKRRNQIYCNTDNYKCRNYFNNNKAWEAKNQTKELEDRIQSNRKVLKRLYEKDNGQEYSKDFLLGAEFDFCIYTSQAKENSNAVFYSLDYGITETKASTYKIVKLK